MQNAFRYFNSSPEIIRLAVMMYVRFPLSLQQVESRCPRCMFITLLLIKDIIMRSQFFPAPFPTDVCRQRRTFRYRLNLTVAHPHVVKRGRHRHARFRQLRDHRGPRHHVQSVGVELQFDRRFELCSQFVLDKARERRNHVQVTTPNGLPLAGAVTVHEKGGGVPHAARKASNVSCG